MFYEGVKETENTRIERDFETNDEIEMLYSFGVVLFEHSIIESGDYCYSICYFAPDDIYDVVVEDNKSGKVLSYEVKKTLDSTLTNYFNLVKNESVHDERGNLIKCLSHSVEYTL